MFILVIKSDGHKFLAIGDVINEMVQELKESIHIVFDESNHLFLCMYMMMRMLPEAQKVN